jgi:myo-inositol 2-dehydrogenase / D-chiro-inositol 1-dehydrogenase
LVVAGQVRIAIVGCGRMGSVRARAAKASGGSPVVFCDVDVERAQRLASLVQPRGTVVDNWRSIDFAAVDAVVVCTPSFTRGPLEREAIRAGVSLFVEKPVGVSIEQCIPVLRALDENPKNPSITAVGYMNRYRPSVADARWKLKNRRILGIAAYWAAAPYGVSWWKDHELSGGPLNDYATHLIDLARYFAGDIVSVQAFTTTSHAAEGPAESGAVIMRFRSSAVGSVVYSAAARTKGIGFHIIHEDGTLDLVGWNLRLQSDGNGESTAENLDRDGIFVDELRVFLNAVKTGSCDAILSDYRDACRTQRVVDAVKRALLSNNVETVRDQEI